MLMRPPDIAGDLWLRAFRDAYPDRPRVASKLMEWFMDGRLNSIYPDVLPTLEAIQCTGLSMGVVSNFADCLPRRLKEAGIADFFDTIVVSDDVGIKKPDERIFAIAAERLGVIPRRVLYVGDNPQVDCAGALHAGMCAVLVCRDDSFTCKDARIIRDLRQLPALLAAPGGGIGASRGARLARAQFCDRGNGSCCSRT